MKVILNDECKKYYFIEQFESNNIIFKDDNNLWLQYGVLIEIKYIKNIES